jgi:hypothetical protein
MIAALVGRVVLVLISIALLCVASVMRLSKPMFKSIAGVVSESWDLAASSLPHPDPSTSSFRGSSPYHNAFTLSEQLVLPAAFGSIYVGEVFASYISIMNSSNSPISSLSIKAELQTTSNKRYTVLRNLSLSSALALISISCDRLRQIDTVGV